MSKFERFDDIKSPLKIPSTPVYIPETKITRANKIRCMPTKPKKPDLCADLKIMALPCIIILTAFVIFQTTTR